MVPAPPTPDGGRAALVRLALWVTLASAPLLAIPADVVGLVPMHLSAGLVVAPLAVGAGLLALFDPMPLERIVIRGAGWGAFATLVYDVFRLDTVYLLGWWGDFIPTMGTWVIDRPGEAAAGAVVGYLWRYLGDGAGIGVVFFVLVAATGLPRFGRRRLVLVATGFAVFPVWTGLVGTVALSSRGQERMFALTPTTVTLSLIGHLIFGVVLGLGCARSGALDRDWPWPSVTELLGPWKRHLPTRHVPDRPVADGDRWGPWTGVDVVPARPRRDRTEAVRFGPTCRARRPARPAAARRPPVPPESSYMHVDVAPRRGAW